MKNIEAGKYKKGEKTLTQIQSEAAEAILALSENGKRASGYGMTFLNKRSRGLAAIRRHYFADVAKLGFNERQISEQWGDIKDYASLYAACED